MTELTLLRNFVRWLLSSQFRGVQIQRALDQYAKDFPDFAGEYIQLRDHYQRTGSKGVFQ